MRHRFWILGAALGLLPLQLSSLTEPTACARPVRRPGVHALLLDLAQIEAFNGERDRTRRGIASHRCRCQHQGRRPELGGA